MSENVPVISCPSGTLVLMDLNYLRDLLEGIRCDAILPDQAIAHLAKASIREDPEDGQVKTIPLRLHPDWKIIFCPKIQGFTENIEFTLDVKVEK